LSVKNIHMEETGHWQLTMYTPLCELWWYKI